MAKTIKEFVTYWGPSITDWNDGTEKRFVIERDEELLKKGAENVGRRMEKISLNTIFAEGVVTGVDMVNGFMPHVLYANDDIIIEVANCDREQGGWHRNLGADEWAFQYKGSRTLNSETGPITINGNGWAAITAPAGGTGITINAGGGDNVSLIVALVLRSLLVARHLFEANLAGLTFEDCDLRDAHRPRPRCGGLLRAALHARGRGGVAAHPGCSIRSSQAARGRSPPRRVSEAAAWALKRLRRPWLHRRRLRPRPAGRLGLRVTESHSVRPRCGLGRVVGARSARVSIDSRNAFLRRVQRTPAGGRVPTNRPVAGAALAWNATTH